MPGTRITGCPVPTIDSEGSYWSIIESRDERRSSMEMARCLANWLDGPLDLRRPRRGMRGGGSARGGGVDAARRMAAGARRGPRECFQSSHHPILCRVRIGSDGAVRRRDACDTGTHAGGHGDADRRHRLALDEVGPVHGGDSRGPRTGWTVVLWLADLDGLPSLERC